MIGVSTPVDDVSALSDDAVSTLVDDAVSTLVGDLTALVDGASAPCDGVSAGVAFAAGTMISGSARARGSSSLSDFAVSFGANASSILL